MSKLEVAINYSRENNKKKKKRIKRKKKKKRIKRIKRKKCRDRFIEYIIHL